MNNDQRTESKLLMLLTQDEDQAKRFLAAKKDIIEKTENLGKHVKDVLQHYTAEIAEGTKKKQLLLEQGTYLRDEKDESDPYKGFLPSQETPILNFLFFSTRDGNYNSNISSLRESQDIDKDLEELRSEFDRQHGAGFDDYDDLKAQKALPQEMESFLYNNMNHETFKKIKKLKTISLLPTSNETKIAKTKCLEFCIKYNLDYDKIPSYL